MKKSSCAVLMATYNGEEFIQEQLASIYAQKIEKKCELKLYISDDGSTDSTLRIIKSFQDACGEKLCIEVITGARRGSTQNFLSLIYNKSIQADYYAFADQDDVWYEDKLCRAINHLDKYAKDVAGLYASRLYLTDKNKKKIGFSPLYTRQMTFKNALVNFIKSI